MDKSIFDYEVRINIAKEMRTLRDVLYLENSIWWGNDFFNLFGFINNVIFPKWKYKGIFLDFADYLDRMDIDIVRPYSTSEIDLLSVLEVLINLWPYIIFHVKKEDINIKVQGYFESTIPVILEKLNYEVVTEGNKRRLVKRSADVDSIIECAPKIANLLLDYNDIRNNNLESKKKILKGIDLYIEENKRVYKSLNNKTYDTIQSIVNNLGINHPIKEKYKDLSENELIKWYDKCFKCMIHLIRCAEINDINNEKTGIFD